MGNGIDVSLIRTGQSTLRDTLPYLSTPRILLMLQKRVVVAFSNHKSPTFKPLFLKRIGSATTGPSPGIRFYANTVFLPCRLTERAAGP